MCVSELWKLFFHRNWQVDSYNIAIGIAKRTKMKSTEPKIGQTEIKKEEFLNEKT
jgi:hypothetical protein